MSLLPLLHRQQIRFMKINSNIQISPSKNFSHTLLSMSEVFPDWHCAVIL